MVVDYPGAEAERRILQLNREEARAASGNDFTPAVQVSQETISQARSEILNMHLAPELEEYIVNLVVATREPDRLAAGLAAAVQFGASPRASIAIDRASRAHAWLAGRDYVGPDDIQSVAADVLRHRILLSFEAEADGMTPDQFIDKLIAGVGVP